MIHELRIYDVLPGQWERWTEIFSKQIMPIYLRKGASVAACWKDLEKGKFVWIRAFKDEEHMKKVSEAVVNSREFQQLWPQFGSMIKVAEVRKLAPTEFSPFK
jgi:hypothetical protein